MSELLRMFRSRAFWIGVRQGWAAPIGVLVYGWRGYWNQCEAEIAALRAKGGEHGE